MSTYGHYIDGEWKPVDGEVFESREPASGEKLGEFSQGGEEEVEAAVEAADEAFEEWRTWSRIDRAELMWDVYQALKDDADSLGELVSRECGKELSEGRADVVEAAHMVEWAAGDARHPNGEVVPSEVAAKDSYMRRKPRGVVGCITPWNFPVAIPFWHLAVTLVEGNTAVWKPSEHTPLCAHRVTEILDDAGFPDGVVNLVQGYGDAGAAVVDSDVDAVIFTGSAEVGEEVERKVASDPDKYCTCEMGGKNAVVVTANADLDLAVHSAVMSAFKTTGQRCVSAERVIVNEDVLEEFRERFVDAARRVKVGDPLDDDTFMGPLAGEFQMEKYMEYVDIAKDEADEVLTDRSTLEDPPNSEGFWAGPFVYEAEFDPSLRVLTEEVFGPHVGVVPYSGGVERAVEIHDATPYGLAGAIVSEDYRELNYFRDHADVGLGYANLPSIGAEVQLPFGGVKRSGSGFPYAREVIESVTHRTAWTVNNSEDVEMAQGLSAEIHTEDE